MPLDTCYKPHIAQISHSSEGSGAGSTDHRHALVSAYQEQDSIFARPFAILSQAIVDHAFPAASVAVTSQGSLVAWKALGRFTYQADSPAVTPASVFDLASVSKVVATTTMAMLLYERGILDLEMPVVAVVPEFVGRKSAQSSDAGGTEHSLGNSRRREITIRMLLAHCSGLPAYERLFQRTNAREALLHAAFSTPLAVDPGTRAKYSDIGFIILGVTLERLADESLDRFCQREVFGPLGMAHTTFNPPEAWRSRIPPTVDDETFRRRIIQGEVQDENASVLGGVAGHAGVFSTAEDVAVFANAMLAGGRPVLRPETVEVFTRAESVPAGTSRALGWDTPSSPSQSGKYFSPGSYGHLGYTGTSLWIDPVRQLSVTLLTNRTWPDCSSQAIKEVRPKFHDAVVEALGKG